MEALAWLVLAVALAGGVYIVGPELLGLIDRHPVENPNIDAVGEFHQRTVRVIDDD
jgi:hypothetical protein